MHIPSKTDKNNHSRGHYFNNRINEVEPKPNLIQSFFQGVSINPQYIIKELLEVPLSLHLAL